MVAGPPQFSSNLRFFAFLHLYCMCELKSERNLHPYPQIQKSHGGRASSIFIKSEIFAFLHLYCHKELFGNLIDVAANDAI